MPRLPLVVIFLLTLLSGGAVGAEPLIPILNLKGPIGPATSDYVERGLEQAREQGAEAVVLRIDTPGGLDSAMRDIIKSVLSSPVPVVAYVAPSGARAASAGTYILYASHVAAMAPGTSVGAATPVPIGLPSPLPSPPRPERQPEKNGEPDEEQTTDDTPPREPKPAVRPTMGDKAVSDAAAYIRSLARMRGRNADWAEKAVREAASLGAEEALEIGVIDIVAPTLEDLLAQLDGRQVVVLGQTRSLSTKAARTVEIEADWRTELLAVITNPNVAYILMLVGIYGLMFEFINPGALVPGIVGAVCLVLALYALNVLPINYAGLALMLLGIGLMTAEAFAPSFGVLGIGGAAAFAIGSVILFEAGGPHFAVSWAVVGAVALSSLAFSMIVIAMAVKARRRPVVTGRREMIGSKGQVLEWSGRTGRVRTHGEIWQASAHTPLEPGQEIRVASLEELTLVVEPVPKKDEQ
ncbi:MAG: nodulation protein NfeD [Alphaproteobacteria bacterium]|nr:nodulation protein NfeD [Alphaproteobacteria bacterium]